MATLVKTAPLQKSTFPVTGMTCAACAVSVESILKSEEGVADAAVNFATQTVLVEYDPSKAKPDHMQKALQGLGYDMVIAENPDTEALEKQKEAQYQRDKMKTIAAFVLALPVVVIGMFLHHTLPYANWISLVLTTPVLFWLGNRFFVNAIRQARHFKANMDTLVALSTGIAFIFSAFNTIYPQFLRSKGLEPHVYYESAAVVIAFILLGKLLEEGAKSRTSSAIKKLMGLQPKTVKVIRQGIEQEVKLAEVLKGEQIIIRPGEKMPVDGAVVSGHSFVDESMISGEPLAVEKLAASKVFAGTINQKGSLTISAEKIGSETLLGQIIRTVQEAQGSKAPVQKLVDKVAGIFVPVVMSIALFTFVAWYLIGGEHYLTQAMMSALTVLIIACPCALGLATPTAIMVGVGKAAENGILIKDAESLEQTYQVNALVLDKTGTITQGKPQVTDVIWINGLTEQPTYERALFSIETQSEHPLAEAVTRHFASKSLATVPIKGFESIPGRGVRATIDDQTYHLGNATLLQENGIVIPEWLRSQADELKNAAKTVIYFASQQTVLGAIAISDAIKENSAQAVRELKAKGIDIYMLTGDNIQTAQAVAQQVGIEHFKAEVLPGEKAAFIKQLQSQGKIVAMAGDGINDSEALALADVGIAMGSGTDIAMNVAKMTLMHSDLAHISKAIHVSKLTIRTIRQNLFWAFIYNLIGIPLAAGLLYPWNGFLLDPMIAGAAMALSSVSVVSNSLRLKAIA